VLAIHQGALVQLSILTPRLSICRLESDNGLPAWLPTGGFLSITRTADELSIVCEERYVPDGVQSERGWVGLKVQGPIDFSQVGVLASLAKPLAESGVSIFAISTYDTDYLLVRGRDLEQSVALLAAAGHKIHRE
jgi:hypothetical protein